METHRLKIFLSFFHSFFSFSLKHVFTSFPNLHSPVVRIYTRQRRCSSVMGLWKEVPERENKRKMREGRKKKWREARAKKKRKKEMEN